MIKYEHPILPPSLIVVKDKKYLVPGFKEVHIDTKLDDIEWVKTK